jgi:hypothetical protein
MGGYLNVTVNESMTQVEVSLQLLNEISEHMKARRTREASNAVHIELFLVYNNYGESIGSLPHFCPTDCVDLFSKDCINEFELEIMKTHLDPINKIFGDVGRLAEQN